MGALDDFVKEQLVEAGYTGPVPARPAPTGLFLSPAELFDLTGYVRASAQIQWLQERYWPFEIDARRRPRVLREALSARLGGVSPATGPNRRAKGRPQVVLS